MKFNEIKDLIKSRTLTTIVYLGEDNKIKDRKTIRFTKKQFLSNLSTGSYPVFKVNREPTQFQTGAFYILEDGNRIWTYVKED